jgi:hypothetical protein
MLSPLALTLIRGSTLAPTRRGLLVFLLNIFEVKVYTNVTGPNVNKISSDVPEGCSVDQAVYVVRHGSRYPDPGAYAEWQALHEAVYCFRRWLDGCADC